MQLWIYVLFWPLQLRTEVVVFPVFSGPLSTDTKTNKQKNPTDVNREKRQARIDSQIFLKWLKQESSSIMFSEGKVSHPV